MSERVERKVDEPYFIEVGDNGCSKCGHDRTWDVIDPEGNAGGTSYGNEEDAQEIADMLNDAYACGLSALCSQREATLRECAEIAFSNSFDDAGASVYRRILALLETEGSDGR